jgi:peptidyl-prolyl cis-trans isomerase B (cyclophilin B)
VWGRTYSDASLDRIQHKTDSLTKSNLTFTPEIREYYKTVGGTPHLDGMYTVFGQVIQGLDVVDAIDHVATDENDRPLEDVRIVKASVIK